MIKSMTGYGRTQQVIDGRDILVEIRSVNHRYYEFSSRLPRAYGYLDEKLKSFLQGKINRGKVEVSVTINNTEGKDALIQVNTSMVKGYLDALHQVNEKFGLRDDLSLSTLIRLPDTFNVQKAVDDEEEIWECVSAVAEKAAENFVAMRISEGERLKTDVKLHSNAILDMVSMVEKLSPKTVENYRKLKDAGIGTYILFQETYHKESYEKLHPTGCRRTYSR